MSFTLISASIRRRWCFALLVVSSVVGFTQTIRSQAPQPVPGQNINMLGGLGADPFLQKQNEPSIAFSTRNPCHLMGGANDYRTVELPGLPDDQEIGDAWVGLFKSIDCGQTWKSDLVPGYPQDQSPEGNASPAKGMTTAADPVVRSGAGGLFFYGFIAFNRGSNVGRVAVARFIDNNNQESGDPFQYLGTTLVASGSEGRFLDKQTVAVRMLPGTTCNINGQVVPGHDVFVAWTQFTGNGIGQGDGSEKGRVYVARLGNCGQTLMGNPKRIQDGNHLSQGTSLAVDPVSGHVYVAWRQFARNNQPDAIYISRSTNGGSSFSNPEVVPILTATQPPFDQGTTANSFRTNAFPSLAVDHAGRLWLAMSIRGFGPLGAQGDARVVLMLRSSWSGPWTGPVPVDSPGFDFSNPPGDPNIRGHQIMPALAYGGGRLHIVWYDVRDTAAFVGNNPGVFGPFIQEVTTGRRHTLDVRGAELQIAPDGNVTLVPYGGIIQDLTPQANNPVPKISQYLLGGPATSDTVQPLQFNRALLRLYAGGTKPFIGDYLDVQTVPYLLQGGQWVPNLFNTNPMPFQVAWTDNRDALVVSGDPATLPYRAPLPPGSQVPGDCSALPATTRNSNVYTSRITPGVFVFAPGNTKTTLGPEDPRAFPVGVSNLTDRLRRFRLVIPAQPANASASFSAFGSSLVTTIFVDIPSQSSAARTVYVRSTNVYPPVLVLVQDVTGVGDQAPGIPVGSALLNGDPQNPEIENPEIENPEIENPEIENVEVHNPEIENPEIENPEIENPEIENPEIENPEIENRNVQNPEIENPEIENPEIENPEIENPEIENPEIENGSMTDVTVDVTNNGNTTSSYQVNFAVGGDTRAWLFQLIAWRSYVSPTAVDCVLAGSAQAQVLANIVNPDISGVFRDQNDSDPRNASVILRPGETIKLTLRAIDKDASPTPIPGGDGNPATPFVPFCAAGTTCEVTNPIVVRTRAQAPNTGETEPTVDVEAPDQGANNWPVRFNVQPTTTADGDPISPPVAVELRDITGAVLPGVNVTVSLKPDHPGATLTGTVTRLTNATGVAFFDDLEVSPPGTGYSLIATVTSFPEFAATSTTFDVVGTPVPTFIVTNSTSGGPGSLRQAILDANANPGLDNITFAIPSDGGVVEIELVTPLPPVTSPVLIDGWTQEGWAGTPLVQVEWTGAIGNEVGVEFAPGSANSTVRGLRFSRFGDNTVATSGIGVWIRTLNITVQGCYFGINETTEVSSIHHGIRVDSGGGLIGGTSAVYRNVIAAGFTGVNVTAGIGATIAGNYIGTDPTGEQDWGNSANGISVFGPTSNLTIGGSALGSGNLISGNDGNAVQVIAGGGGTPNFTTIARNIIGLARPGIVSPDDLLPNSGYGIFVSANNTTIGLPDAGNYVALSGFDGIHVVGPADNTTIQGNVVGWGLGGSPRGNSLDGIVVVDADNVVIGGTLGASTRNVVANNNRNIAIHGIPSAGTVVRGNYVGLNVAGSDVGPNTDGEGIYSDSPDTLIIGNVVAGAGQATFPGTGIPGVFLATGADGSEVQGNRIGTNAAGTVGLGNQGPGVRIDAPFTLIGGPTPAEGNLISGNRVVGILVTASGHDAVIESNLIGTDAAGSIDIGNGGGPFGAGIMIAGNDVRVGGALHTAVNTIRHNDGPGIAVTGGTGSHFPGILSYDNIGMGIDLNYDDFINNDSLDADVGANNLQNTVAGVAGGFDGTTLRLTGTLRGQPNQSVTVRWYRNTACAPGSEAEGEEFLTQTVGLHDGAGQGTLLVSIPSAVAGGTVSATLIDSLGNQSEFIDCAPVAAGTGLILFEQPVDGAAQSLDVTVFNAAGGSVPGAIVTVRFTNESLGNTFNGGLTEVSALTNAAGQAVLNFSIDNPDPTISLEFTAALPGFSFPRGVSVTFSRP